MKVIRDGKVAARGVTQLMYVGDVPAAIDKPTPTEVGVGVVAAVLALKTKGTLRLAALGVAAWVGYKLYAAKAAVDVATQPAPAPPQGAN